MTLCTRVMILGGSGAGKSHLALRLAALAGLPSVHMDELSWRPGFVHRSTAELDRMTREIHARDHWIIEGGHYETCLERARRAHLLICLDVPPLVQACRIVLRSLRHHGRVRPCMAEGCPELFGSHTIEALRYARRSHAFHQDRIRDVLQGAAPTLGIRRFRTGFQVNRFLSRCRPAPAGPGFLPGDG